MASGLSGNRLRGAITKVITQQQQEHQQHHDQQPLNIWTEVARGMRKASLVARDDGDDADQLQQQQQQQQQQQHQQQQQQQQQQPAAAAADADEGKRKPRKRLQIRSLLDHLDSVFNPQQPSSEQEDNVRLEDFLQLQHLKKLRSLYETHRPPAETSAAAAAAAPGGGGGGGGNRRRRRRRQAGMLNLTEFKAAIAMVVGDDRFSTQVQRMFFKLDTNNSGHASWSEFCNYMLLQLAEASAAANQVKPPFAAEPRIRNVLFNRQEPTARLLLTDSPIRPISVSKTGCIMLWDCSLKLESRYEMQQQQQQQSTQQQQPQQGDSSSTSSSSSGSSSARRMFSEWAMDAVYMENCRKLVVSSTGRDLKFFDIASSTVKEEFVLYGMRAVPTVLRFYYSKQESSIPYLAANTDSHLIFGDDCGGVTQLTFKKPMQQLFDVAPDPHHRSQRIWFYELHAHTKFVECQTFESLHSEPINDLHLIPDANCIVTCSQSPSCSVQVYDLIHKRQVYNFKLRKGAECFDLCRSINLLVTGSSDHLLRFWNPYVPSKHTALLEGHSCAILSVKIHQVMGVVISYARDSVIKVWDIKSYACIQTVTVRIPFAVADKLPEHMNNPMTLHLSSNTAYITIGDHIVQYRLGKASSASANSLQTHKQQLSAILYNPLFKQVTTAADDSTMAMWDIETGNKCLAFSDAHEGQEVTCIAYDAAYRRLLTGGRNGSIRVWNFQTGHVMHELENNSNSEISGICVVPMQQRILTVGWNKRITCYKDNNPEQTHCEAIDWKGGVAHNEDILTCDYCSPDLLATGSYDGALIVWNVEYERLLMKLRSGVREPIECKMQRAKGETASGKSRKVGNSRPNSRHQTSFSRSSSSNSSAPIDKLLFLKRRAADKRLRESGLLVTSAAGAVSFWSIHGDNKLMAEFYAAAQPDQCVLAMAAVRDNGKLVTGDTAGWVRAWDIQQFAVLQQSVAQDTAPPIICEFRAHEVAIVSLDVAELEFGQFVVTGSVDCTAKLFDIYGNIVGTFGQPRPWELVNRKTWKQAKIDRQKFFEEAEAVDLKAAQAAAEEEIQQQQQQPPDGEPPLVTAAADAPDVKVKTRSQTMPAMRDGSVLNAVSSSGSRKHRIGLKAEKDFQRIRATRSDRRSEFGEVVHAAAGVATGPGASAASFSPYSVLRTTEFKNYQLSDNLPQPSWQRSRTTVGLQSDSGQTAEQQLEQQQQQQHVRLAAAGVVKVIESDVSRTRLPPIVASPRSESP